MQFTDDTADALNKRDIYSVSRLNREVRTVLESGFPLLWIEAELSNFARPTSGHWYFTLKDEAAQVKAAMFRNKNMLVRLTPKEGMQVLVRARISLYEARGDYQLIVEHMEEAGEGELRRRFEALKQKLASEGLFDADQKQALPEHIRRVGIVTSSSGAAIHDIITTLQRRFPMETIILYPTAVQGKGAEQEIAAAIKIANQRNEVDVLIVGRGGGSLEDLWAFNEEVVARAIYASTIPVVSAVGHEVDFTIADFVADVRAATPTAAAELVSSDRYQWLHKLQQLQQRLGYLMQQQLRQGQQQLHWVRQRLKHPGERVQQMMLRLDELEQRRQLALQHALQHRQNQLHTLQARLQQHNPLRHVQRLLQQNQNFSQRIQSSMQYTLKNRQQQLQHLMHTLDAVSPLNTLKRGYAIVTTETQQVVRRAQDTQVGQTVTTRLAEGHLRATITEIHDD